MSSPFTLPHVWPAQRANRKRMSAADIAYSQRVRRNKQRAAQKARGAKKKLEAEQRARNRAIIKANEREDRKQIQPHTDTRSRQQKAADTRRLKALRTIGL